MTFAQLMELYFERSTALQNYWTLYVVIIGGLLAFSSMRQHTNRLTTILVSILFLCFAYKNCGAIIDVTNQRYATLEAINATPIPADVPSNAAALLKPTLVGTDVAGVRRFHIFCDALTVLTLWSMEWRRRSRARELERQGVVIPVR